MLDSPCDGAGGMMTRNFAATAAPESVESGPAERSRCVIHSQQQTHFISSSKKKKHSTEPVIRRYRKSKLKKKKKTERVRRQLRDGEGKKTTVAGIGQAHYSSSFFPPAICQQHQHNDRVIV
jgi:hypothetical protein